MNIESKNGNKNTSSSTKKTSWLLSLRVYKVSKSSPEIFTVYTKKNLAVIQVLNTESRSGADLGFCVR